MYTSDTFLDTVFRQKVPLKEVSSQLLNEDLATSV